MSIQNLKETEKKKVEYIHEEFYDTKTKGKWTIFNKHAVELTENTDDEEGEFACKEDSIIEQMKLDDRTQHPVNICSLPETTWLQLYEAKCYDLGIPCKSDKQQERFIGQMMLH